MRTAPTRLLVYAFASRIYNTPNNNYTYCLYKCVCLEEDLAGFWSKIINLPTIKKKKMCNSPLGKQYLSDRNFDVMISERIEGMKRVFIIQLWCT